MAQFQTAMELGFGGAIIVAVMMITVGVVRLQEGRFKRRSLLFPLTGMVLATVGYGIQLNYLNHVRELQQNGRVAEAEISGMESTGSSTSPSYFVKYTFVAENGAGQPVQVLASEQVPVEYFERVESGQAVEVYYARGNPGVVQIREFYQPGSWQVLQPFYLCMICAAVCFVFGLWELKS